MNANNKRRVRSEDGPIALMQHEERKFPHAQGVLDKQANIAMHYGFTPIKTPELGAEDRIMAGQFPDKNGEKQAHGAAAKKDAGDESDSPLWQISERIAMLRSYAENEMQSLTQPIQVYYRRPFPGSGERRPRTDAQASTVHFGLDIFGTERGVGEALVIQTALAALRDDGLGNLLVELNSIGDRDAMARHERELGNYFKKHAASLRPEMRSVFKCNPFSMLCSDELEHEAFREGAPKSVSYLGESGRKHFMEVLEYLESLEVPYRINHALLGNRSFASHSIFKIKHVADDKETTVASGSRYNPLSRKLGFKKELPAAGISVCYKRPQAAAESFKAIASPKFYFIQFGSDAHFKSLALIERLRTERIPLYHSLTYDKFLDQMTAAENLKVPFVLIMGQKEALENSIVVRDMNSRAQETVGIEELAGYLRKLK